MFNTTLIVTILFLLSSGLSISQSREWGLEISPALSKGRLPHGVGVVYPGAPFWAGNLVIEERNEPAFSAEIFREKTTKWRNVSSKISLGYLSCGDYQHFDYDFANSFNNIVSIENRFRYLTFNVMAKYSLPVGKGTAFASLGPHFGYLIYSTETSINFVNNEYTQGSYSFLPNEKRFNYGPQYSLGGRYKRISAEAFYKSYYRVPYHNRARRVIMFGVALSFYFQKE